MSSISYHLNSFIGGGYGLLFFLQTIVIKNNECLGNKRLIDSSNYLSAIDIRVCILILISSHLALPSPPPSLSPSLSLSLSLSLSVSKQVIAISFFQQSNFKQNYFSLSYFLSLRFLALSPFMFSLRFSYGIFLLYSSLVSFFFPLFSTSRPFFNLSVSYQFLDALHIILFL